VNVILRQDAFQLGGRMPTIVHCRTRARELAALAEREPENRPQHLNDAAAWSLLARRMEEAEIILTGRVATA
jgi:hypothetical protein